jgi:hypothetical protein
MSSQINITYGLALSCISHSSIRFLPVLPRISTHGVADDSIKAVERPRESLTNMTVGPFEVIVYKMRLFALNRTKFACSSIAEEDGIIRNVVELGGAEVAGVTVDGE